jgi:hypothetical protein
VTDTMTPAGLDVASALRLLDLAAREVNRAVGDIESTTVEESAQILGDVRAHIAVLRQCEAGIERWIATCFREEGWRDPVELPGIGMVEVRRSTTRRAWDHEGLRARWLNDYVTANGGEVVDPAQIRDALFDVVSVSGWKVTGLKALGIDANDFCQSEPGTPRVVLA